jgi:predicted transcriptional regulator
LREETTALEDRKAAFVTFAVTRDEDHELMEVVRQLAQATDRSRSAVVRLALRDYIDRQQATKTLLRPAA